MALRAGEGPSLTEQELQKVSSSLEELRWAGTGGGGWTRSPVEQRAWSPGGWRLGGRGLEQLGERVWPQDLDEDLGGDISDPGLTQLTGEKKKAGHTCGAHLPSQHWQAEAGGSL